MLRYIKENKEKIIATTAKVVAAIVIPGGLIVLGAYELGKLQQRRIDGETNIQQDTQSSTEGNSEQ